MKVVDNSKKVTSTFADLPIGQAYYDSNDLLCIKTSDCEGVDDNCIVYDKEGGWHTDGESRSSIVRPVRTTLTIEG